MRAETEPNRLIKEKSPYLLQHARNPVDWYPWGKEAFEKARTEAKPIFLSIGYSTCHWCHVMEEESFTHPEIAKFLNEHFVSIKVDREERPDLDHLYMKAVMSMTGAGGWPMSVFLTPARKPFYGGTYFPPEDKWGRPGFMTLLKSIADHWEKNRDQIVKSSDQLTEALEEEVKQAQEEKRELGESVLVAGFVELRSRFDDDHGGFSEAPKFPMGHGLSFLLRYWKRSGDPTALRMVEKTLQEMARGGLYDQLQGGFHRYSTDERWHVPHFEKMLYDQAILARAYLEAYQATRKDEYARTAREVLDYVLRDMTGLEGGFYSAEDADSLEETRKVEGAFYVWTEAEMIALLGAEDAKIFNYCFGVRSSGNAEADPHGEFRGKNILYRAYTVADAAQKFQQSEPKITSILEKSKARLFEARLKRPRPHLDDKVLTDWNGLMIASFALAARVLEEPRYEAAARRAADFFMGRMKTKGDRLLHRFRDGEAGIHGFLEDYAFLMWGLIELYETTFEPRYLEEARRLAGEMIGLFWDESAGGGFLLTGHDAEELVTRPKELYDGAIPSGNSAALLAFLKVGRLTVDRALEDRAASSFQVFADQIEKHPSAYAQTLAALDFAIGPSREIVIAGDREDPVVAQMVRAVNGRFLPNQVIAFHPAAKEEAAKIEAVIPFLKTQTALDGKATAYVCENYVCKLPTTDLAKFRQLLDS